MTQASPNGLQPRGPHKVDNAIIMAAGMSSRFVPLSFGRPKGLFLVRGEILIERQIRQLQEAGIDDITVVVGYLKEQFFYLEEMFGVSIVVNEDYFRYNNPSSLMRVRDRLKNTYVCSSDNYFTSNVFSSQEEDSYYSAVFTPDKTDEYVLTTDGQGRIVRVDIGGENGWYMLGHAYFSREFSQKFVRLLESEYGDPAVRGQLWENLLARHLDELDIRIKKFGDGIIHEFDSLDELRAFDPLYIDNVDSSILRNICSQLGCSQRDITNIAPIKEGMTNTSFRFDTPAGSFVYRHPGRGTDKYIHRANEARSMVHARQLGLDNTFVHMDAATGWKISHYREHVRNMDYHLRDDVTQALAMMRRLHDANIQVDYEFNVWQSAMNFLETIQSTDRACFSDFEAMHDTMCRVNSLVEADGVAKRLCHCDCYAPNFMVHGGGMDLIDWEYSGMDDPATDLGTFICCSDYTHDEAMGVIAAYHDGKPTPDQIRHCVGHVALASYYWYLWAIQQELLGKSVGEYLHIWYRHAKSYGNKAIELYH